MRFLIAFLLFTLPLAASDQSLGVMQFDPPKGWHFADMKKYPQSVKLVVVGKGKTAFPPQLVLGTDNFKGTLQEYINKVAKPYNLSQNTDWKDLGTIRTECGEGHLSQSDVTTEYGTIRMMEVIVIKDDIAYILNASAAKEEFATFYPDFFKSMRSLRYTLQK